MGWTAPATWSVSEVVIASKMNTHIRDNLDYLKGNAGPITLGDRLTLPLVAGTDGKGLRFNNGATDFATLQSLDSGGVSYIFFANNRYFDGTAWQAMSTRAGAVMNLLDNQWIFYSSAASSTALVERARIDASGNLGIGAASPQGPIHVKATNGGCVLLVGQAVTSLQTLAANATVAQRATFFVSDYNNTGGATVHTFADLAVNSLTTYTNNDTITLAVTAAGAITVQRTIGTNGTHNILLWVIYA